MDRGFVRGWTALKWHDTGLISDTVALPKHTTYRTSLSFISKIFADRIAQHVSDPSARVVVLALHTDLFNGYGIVGLRRLRMPL